MKSYSTNGYTRRYSAGLRGERSLSFTDKLVLVLQAVLRIVESDGFAAAFYGISFLLIVGLVGAVEFGRLALGDAVKYSSAIFVAVGIVIYRNNRHR